MIFEGSLIVPTTVNNLFAKWQKQMPEDVCYILFIIRSEISLLIIKMKKNNKKVLLIDILPVSLFIVVPIASNSYWRMMKEMIVVNAAITSSLNSTLAFWKKRIF